MSSHGRAVKTTLRTSRASSGASSSASAPSSSAPERFTTASLESWSHALRTSSGYVSPYPLLPTQATPANNPTAGAADNRVISSSTQPLLSASSKTSQEDSEEASDEDAFPSLALQRPQFQPSHRHSSVATMYDPAKISNMDTDRVDPKAQKQALIEALVEHRINTISELRRTERIFATMGSSDVTQPMTSAWIYYVNSNSLLTELRALSPHYPFSSECLDEAKKRVYQDPASNRSWNLAWLVLAKVQSDQLILIFARAQAARPEMWGGSQTAPQNVERLTAAFVQEWSAALAQLLRFWETPPIASSALE